MPLHGHRERVLRRVQLGASTTPSAVQAVAVRPAAELVDGLVVVGRARHRQVIGQVGAVQDRGQPGCRARPDLVLPVAAWLGGVAVVADHVGQVLVQRAAQGHVHDLGAAADAEHRQPRSSAAASRASSASSRAGRLARSAGGAPRRSGPGRCRRPPERIRPSSRRQRPSIPAAAAAAPGRPRPRRPGRVALGQQHGGPVPDAPAGRLAVGADPDQRACRRTIGGGMDPATKASRRRR